MAVYRGEEGGAMPELSLDQSLTILLISLAIRSFAA